MESCCQGKAKDLEHAARKHRKVLWVVLFINLVMFGVEIVSGYLANSMALTGDSLDMLGDAITYGSSLLVVSLGVSKKAQVARLKAWIMLIFGLIIGVECIWRALLPQIPAFSWMLTVGSLALLANMLCLALLTRFRHDDINMRSVWICSRNDIIANSAVLLAAFAVYRTGSFWPDLLVGFFLAVLFTRSAMSIFREVNSLLNQDVGSEKSLNTQ